MSTRHSVSTADVVAPRLFSAGFNPRLKIRGVYPVVRRAILAKHSPTLTRQQAEVAGAILQRNWPEWQHEYLHAVSEAARVGSTHLAVPAKERVRVRYDGMTPVIDLPRVRGAKTPYAFDQRNCAALCVEEEFSSKIWTRVGYPQDQSPCDLEELRQVTHRYRQQAVDVGEWFYEAFFESTAEAFRGSRRRRDKAILEVTTVGLRIDADVSDEDIDAWLFDDDAPNMHNDLLWEYLRCAGDISLTLSQLQKTSHEWWAMPMAVRTAEGMIVPRRALYLMRLNGDVVQIVGLALDDSGDAELANDVALKLSRFIANGI